MAVRGVLSKVSTVNAKLKMSAFHAQETYLNSIPFQVSASPVPPEAPPALRPIITVMLIRDESPSGEPRKQLRRLMTHMGPVRVHETEPCHLARATRPAEFEAVTPVILAASHVREF